MAFVIGIDGGTESVRVHIFTLTGTCVGSAAEPYPTRFPHPGWAEQDPQDWWAALGKATRAALRDADISPRSVLALTVASTSSSVVALDRHGAPLAPALLWMDVRAWQEADAVRIARDSLPDITHNKHGPVSAEWMLPKALWLKHNRPDLYAASAVICEYQDFLVQRLTGETVASLNTASIRWHYQADGAGFPVDMLALLGLDDLTGKWPQTVLAPGEVVGALTPSAAEHLGLLPHVNVVQGGADAFIGMIGAGVKEPGRVALISGSSHLQLALSRTRCNIPGLWGSYADAVYPGLHVIEGGQSSSGSMVSWTAAILGRTGDFARLDAEAAEIAPGADGIVVLDHFQGGRSPHTDAGSRGAFVGLSLSHTQAHLFRATLESVCLGSRAVLEKMQAHGLKIDDLTIVGGATRSRLWLQLHADTAGLPVNVPEVVDGPGIGAAILAACGAGCFSSIGEGIEAMVRVKEVIEPDPAAHAAYSGIYRNYLALYPALRMWRESHPPRG